MTRFLALFLACTLVTACAGDGDDVFVSAAASLKDAFAALESQFEADHPDLDIVLNVGGSSHLREQILQGAPVDVFASASVAVMEELVEAGRVTAPRKFATTELIIAVPSGNPGAVSGLSDFERDELLLGVCAVEAPCGRYARIALADAGISASVDTEESSVRALLTKIAAGELDAGIVYATDVLAGGDAVQGIEITPSVLAEYTVAVLVDAPHREPGEMFVAFVLSAEGRSILAEYGFGTP